LRCLPKGKIPVEGFPLVEGEAVRRSPFREMNAMYGIAEFLPLQKFLEYSCYTKEQTGIELFLAEEG